MTRHLLLVLLLATGVALAGVARAGEAPAGDPPASEASATAAGGGSRADETQKQKERAGAQDKAPKQPAVKAISGMSILGNQEAPKSLAIVPWKSSELGGSLGISTMLDDSRQPVDREVFLRALSYYEIRAGTKP